MKPSRKHSTAVLIAVFVGLAVSLVRCGNGIETSKFGTTCPLGATFENVDDFLYAANRGSFAARIRYGNNGNLYVAGRGVATDNADHWILRRGKTLGTSWATLDDYVYPGGTGAGAADSILTASGVLFVVGFGTLGVDPRWVVRRSKDEGATWTTVDDFVYETGGATAATAIASATDGALYVAGFGTSTTTHWIVRKSINGGDTWTTIDDFQFANSQNSRANAIAFDSDGVAYVVGSGRDGNNSYWLTRRSISAAGSWTTVDSYLLTNGVTASASDIVFDGDTGVYVTGVASDATLTHAVTRVTKTSGASWATADDFQLSDTTNASFNAIASDRARNPFTVGVGGSLGGAADHWVVRRSVVGSRWSTFDDFRYPPGGLSRAHGVAFDPSGNVYVSGSGLDPSVDRWVVRKASCD